MPFAPPAAASPATPPSVVGWPPLDASVARYRAGRRPRAAAVPAARFTDGLWLITHMLRRGPAVAVVAKTERSRCFRPAATVSCRVRAPPATHARHHQTPAARTARGAEVGRQRVGQPVVRAAEVTCGSGAVCTRSTLTPLVERRSSLKVGSQRAARLALVLALLAVLTARRPGHVGAARLYGRAVVAVLLA